MKKIKSTKRPIEYRLQVAFKLTSMSKGISFGGDLEIPIRKDFGEKINKIKKGEIVSTLRQLAEAIEREDYSLIGLPIDMNGAPNTSKASNKAN